jgi:hypothetical protein
MQAQHGLLHTPQTMELSLLLVQQDISCPSAIISCKVLMSQIAQLFCNGCTTAAQLRSRYMSQLSSCTAASVLLPTLMPNLQERRKDNAAAIRWRSI